MSLYGNLYQEELPPRAKALYMYLKDRANKDGQCWPALKTIARDTSMSKRTVQRAIDDLLASGLLTKESRVRENGGRSSNNYYLKF
ncbi:helix-turn-helix domain-containing protein [Chakrabartyella piscis]|uniref:helix-turn-helix domain-containing protein n=1 Tax=Chakrabartyella piscis TaxID=2918914 RepID=UPI002958AEBD|nr:helix-turn-helix domain-containing protein [Chakrabartyella piscis]